MEIDLRKLAWGENHLVMEAPAEELELQIQEVAFPEPIQVRLNVMKVDGGVTIRGEILCRIKTECFRCLETFEQDIPAEIGLLFERREETPYERWVGSPDDDLKIIPPEECLIDIGEAVREALLLELPMKLICSEECAGLCPTCGTNRNASMCDCGDVQPTSAWAALEELKESLTRSDT